MSRPFVCRHSNPARRPSDSSASLAAAAEARDSSAAARGPARLSASFGCQSGRGRGIYVHVCPSFWGARKLARSPARSLVVTRGRQFQPILRVKRPIRLPTERSKPPAPVLLPNSTSTSS